MMEFLKRMLGVDQESLRVRQRFDHNLELLSSRHKQLCLVGAELQRIVDETQDTTVEISRSQVSSGTSGAYEVKGVEDGRRGRARLASDPSS